MVYVESAVRGRQIIAAARDVLVRDGVARTTMRAVADEAQIPLGTLQHVFPTKQKLLRAVIEDVVEEIAEVLRTSADLDDGLARPRIDRADDRIEYRCIDQEMLTKALARLVLHRLRGWCFIACAAAASWPALARRAQPVQDSGASRIST